MPRVVPACPTQGPLLPPGGARTAGSSRIGALHPAPATAEFQSH